MWSWSQHVETSAGQLSSQFHSGDWEKDLQIDTEKPVVQKNGAKKRITVRYFLNSYKKSKKPLIFKAEIGLRDRGFLEIRVPIS